MGRAEPERMVRFGAISLSRMALPIMRAGGTSIMQVSVDVTDEMRREAEARKMPVIDYVELLVDRGRRALEDDPAVASAIERIRALRANVSRPGH
ncbi:MAG: hypothetical protein KGM96_08710 [Acidobacteriota bacterium]|nr:hypothetical protein [Acidobacteriota bacterium]